MHPQEAAVEYASWVELLLDRGVDVDLSIREFTSVNFSDNRQWEEILYPLMRTNVRCIDFYLSCIVFPVESKQFEGKLVATPWDLFCNRMPSSGFSGTSGTQLVYPWNLKQDDLVELQSANAAIVSHFMLPENHAYQSLEPCANASSIIESALTCTKARVLLDVGALVLESNGKFARAWLECSQEDVEAAVYLEGDKLVVETRNGTVQPLTLSPFEEQLGKCICFLDDIHTRGIDLKFPPGTRAVVTLGKGVTRDRLAQAIMRMRLLGQGSGGHTVEFLASSEVDSVIRQQIEQSGKTADPRALDVLSWARSNSVSALHDRFMSWGYQAFNRCRKEIAKEDHSTDGTQVSDGTLALALAEIGEDVIEPDNLSLREMYGGDRTEQAISGIMKGKLKVLLRQTNRSACTTGTVVAKHCQKYVKDVQRHAQSLDEEQERELEQELEEERYVERPGPATPHVPTLSEPVLQLAVSGELDPCSEFLPLTDCFKNTSLYPLVRRDVDAWSCKVFATKDFISTIQDNVGLDSYLKTPRWMVSLPANGESDGTIVLLSMFEVNKLLPHFRRRSSSSPRVLHLLAPRIGPNQSMLFDDPRLAISAELTHPSLPSSLSTNMIQLSIICGNLFFATHQEQDAFCEFLDLCPLPRNEAQTRAFANRQIRIDGFVNLDHRAVVFGAYVELGDFHDSPVQFLQGLIAARGYNVHCTASHVGKILFKVVKDQLGADETSNRDQNQINQSMPTSIANTETTRGAAEEHIALQLALGQGFSAEEDE